MLGQHSSGRTARSKGVASAHHRKSICKSKTPNVGRDRGLPLDFLANTPQLIVSLVITRAVAADESCAVPKVVHVDNAN